MRKIKFVGITAATLLAISPVATSAINGTQEVKAADETSTTTSTSSTDFFKGLLNLLGISDKSNNGDTSSLSSILKSIQDKN